MPTRCTAVHTEDLSERRPLNPFIGPIAYSRSAWSGAYLSIHRTIHCDDCTSTENHWSRDQSVKDEIQPKIIRYQDLGTFRPQNSFAGNESLICHTISKPPSLRIMLQTTYQHSYLDRPFFRRKHKKRERKRNKRQTQTWQLTTFV